MKMKTVETEQKGVGLSADWKKCCLINNTKPGWRFSNLILATILQHLNFFYLDTDKLQNQALSNLILVTILQHLKNFRFRYR